MSAVAAAVANVNAQSDIDQMLIMCGFNVDEERARLIDYERFASLESFGDYTDTMIESMADKNEKRTPASTRVRFGIQRVLYIKAVSFWVRKQRREGIPISIDNLTPDVITIMIQEMNLERTIDSKAADDKLDQPDKFDPKRYIAWERSFENYLDSLRGKLGVPLSYVIRPEEVDVNDAIDDYQRKIWSAPLTGSAYREDNRRVYRIYKDLMIGTDGWTWFNRASNGDGREAHLLITQHYRGDAETALRAAEAEATLNRLHYKNESTFPFERYVTRISECFELMKDNDQELSEAQKVKRMLDGVVTSNAEVIAIKAVVRSTYPNNFDEASRLMAGQIALLFPAAHNDLRNKRKISVVTNEVARTGRGRYNSKPRGGRSSGGGRSSQMLNGVDVSDPTRKFSQDEWKRLRESGFLSWIIDRRNNLGNRREPNSGRGHHRGGRGQRTTENGRGIQIAAVSATSENRNEMSTITHSTKGRMNAGGRAGARFGGQRYRESENNE